MRSSRNLAENIAQIKKKLKQCAANGVRVVVFPECALTGYFNDLIPQITAAQLTDAEHQVAAACREAGVYAVIGTPWREGDKLYNSAVVIGPDGRVIERYHKIQLAERWPHDSHESGIRIENKIGPYRAQIHARAVENTVYIVHANAPANPDTSGSHGQSRLLAPDGNIIEEATIFGEDVLIATFDLRKATAAMARGSVNRGPFRQWWQEGVKQVRIID
jgi:predicted amidohydrolase